jgi:S1-C subfamily serine protease
MNTVLRSAVLSVILAAASQAADTAPTDSTLREQAEKKLQQAQERLDQSAREIADLSAQLYAPHPGGDPTIWMSSGLSRALLGVNVDEAVRRGDAATKEAGGVRIISVTPGGPADKAGLRANDVLTSVNGKDLRLDDKHSPRQRVISAMHNAKADVAVSVEYRRDGKDLKAQVTPKSASFEDAFNFKGMPEGLEAAPGGEFNNFAFAFGPHPTKGFGSVEFLSLTPGLGHYFGTDKGLLVVHAPTDERLKLQEGDVVLDIDGRVPNNASHAFRIFSSYRAGEMLKLHIMREQKRVELPVEVPADTSRLGSLSIEGDMEGLPRLLELSKKSSAGANL